MDLKRGDPNICLGLPQELFDDIIDRAVQNWPKSETETTRSKQQTDDTDPQAPTKFGLAKVNKSFHQTSIPFLNTEWIFNNGTIDSLSTYLETRLSNGDLAKHVKHCRVEWSETMRLEAPKYFPIRLIEKLRRALRINPGEPVNLQTPGAFELDHLFTHNMTVYGEQALLNLVFYALPALESMEFICSPKNWGALSIYSPNRKAFEQKLKPKFSLASNLRKLTIGVDASTYDDREYGRIHERSLSDILSSTTLKEFNIMGLKCDAGQIHIANHSIETLVVVDISPDDLQSWLSQFRGIKALAIHGSSIYEPFSYPWESFSDSLRQFADQLETLHVYGHETSIRPNLFKEFTNLTALSVGMCAFLPDLDDGYHKATRLSQLLPPNLVHLRLYALRHQLLMERGFDYIDAYLQDLKKNKNKNHSLKDILLVVQRHQVQLGDPVVQNVNSHLARLFHRPSVLDVSVSYKFSYLDPGRCVKALPTFAGKDWGYERGLIKPFEDIIQEALDGKND